MVLCGINSRFQLLSPCVRQVTHALLTRPPLSIKKSIRKLHSQYSVRLACVKHAASVHPEPGSNSHVKVLSGQENVDFSQFSYPFTVCLYFRTFKKSTFCLPARLGTLRVPRSWTSIDAARHVRPGSARRILPASKLAVRFFSRILAVRLLEISGLSVLSDLRFSRFSADLSASAEGGI